MQAFVDALLDTGLEDLEFEGYPFTWDKAREGYALIEERLDRAVSTENGLRPTRMLWFAIWVGPIQTTEPYVSTQKGKKERRYGGDGDSDTKVSVQKMRRAKQV
ncbi:unnamed protein product [Linum trigynum]|uniref:Uncharacterized protein n=1 Tax=Linum trigynum TaxID=586398 RepID=A0AAV2CF92_9ROSI